MANTVTLTRELLIKLKRAAQTAIFDAQLEDFIERRGVQDQNLFEDCFMAAAPDEMSVVDWILNFTDIAGTALKDYDRRRAAKRESAAR